MISSEVLLSFFAASMSTIIGCFLAYLFRTKNIIVLMAYWAILVFGFTFTCLLLTFVNGNIEYKVNMVLPIVLPLVMFPGHIIERNSESSGYIAACIGGAFIVLVIGFGSENFISAMVDYGISLDDAIKLFILNGIMYGSVSVFSANKYRKSKSI